MEYKGISSIIKEGEEVKSKREVYTVIKALNIGLHNTYLAKNSKGKEVILKQFKNRDEKFFKNQRKIFKYLRSIHNQDKRFSSYLEYVYEQFVYKDYLFEVKAKIDGISFDKYLFSEKLPFKKRYYFARELSKIVMLLHKYDIVHSDLKFEQFMVVNNRLKLIDFSNIIIKDEVYLPAGTPLFRSPEHIKNEKIDKKSDIFTLGIMIYNILTYLYPYQAILDSSDFEEKMLTFDVVPLHKLNPNFPYQFSKIISKALSINKDKRPDAFKIFRSFDYFKKPFLSSNNRKFFINQFPLFFNQKVASFLLPKWQVKFIYNPHFKIDFDKESKKTYISTFKLNKGFFYPKLNEKSFRKEELKNGDTIRIGKIVLKYYDSLLG